LPRAERAGGALHRGRRVRDQPSRLHPSHRGFRSLIDAEIENQRRIKCALEVLPDKAIQELGDDDFRDYIVVRVSDEILVDIMTAACGIEYAEASSAVEVAVVQGVPIPFATPELLLRMKQTYREKDVGDCIFLHRKIAERQRDQ
jgi:hypothetical protein